MELVLQPPAEDGTLSIFRKLIALPLKQEKRKKDCFRPVADHEVQRKNGAELLDRLGRAHSAHRKPLVEAEWEKSPEEKLPAAA